MHVFTFTDLSSDPDTIFVPSLLIHTDITLPLCPSRVDNTSPVETSHTYKYKYIYNTHIQYIQPNKLQTSTIVAAITEARIAVMCIIYKIYGIESNYDYT